MPSRYIYSFSEPINPEELHALFQQAHLAGKRSPLDIQQLLDHSQITLGVWDEDRLIAFARAITDDLFRALINDVVVDRAYRGQGITARMLDKMLKRMQHIEAIMLDCLPELGDFYAQFGFQAQEKSPLIKYNPR